MSMRFTGRTVRRWHILTCVTVAVVLVLSAGCGKSKPTTTPVPLTPTNTPVPPTPTRAPRPTSTPRPPLDGSGGGVVAFYSERDGNAEIYVMNIADAPRSEGTYGSDLRRLTNNRADDTSPAWSPDGTQIAFVSDRDDPNPINCSPDCDYKIYVMNSDGSGQRRLTDSPLKESHPAWSPDGAWIVFDTDHDDNGNHEIYVVNSDGSGLRQLTDDAARDHWADWSPDGAQVRFSSTRDGYAEIYVMSVVADSLRSEGADGGNLQRLTHSEEVWDDIPRWSPDGAHIAFVSAHNGNRDIYTMGSDGSDPQRLTSDPAEDMCPDWSPDGAQIVFNSERDGNWEIYVVNVDGSGLRRLTDHQAGDYQPAWRPAVADGDSTSTTFGGKPQD
jgi:Tol biopolymer transport system component